MTTTESQRVVLMFHELGHCDLDRDHTEEKRENGTPKSIMNKYIFSYDPVDEQYYFDELFGR